MADYYYGFAKGSPNNPQSVLVGTATNSTDIELHISTTNNPRKRDVILALRTFEAFLLSNGVGTTTGPGVDIPPD